MQNSAFAPYRDMKNISFMAAAFLCAANIVFAGDEISTDRMSGKKTSEQFINWNILWSGAWEESASTPLKGNLHSRGELKLDALPLGLLMRVQALDRRPLNLDPDDLWGNPEKSITNYTGGLYHRPTGSRLLYGVLDEWGLPARIRNPWIRSPPYANNYKPIITDLKTTASSTKEDEIYLYLSSPVINLSEKTRIRGFFSAQTEIEDYTPAFSAGIDFAFAHSKNPFRLQLETFYTGRMLPPTKAGTWFSDKPALPEREFHLYAIGFHFTYPVFSISSDIALSETFAWGTDIYANLGVTVTPKLPFGNRARPLAISFAVDSAGEKFVCRDGAKNREGYRNAAKIEWKGRYNSLVRLNTVLRGTGFGEDFNRSSSGLFLRFPANRKNNNFIQLTRISMTADRNASNPEKINDTYSGTVGLRLNLSQIGTPLNRSLVINLQGSIRGLTASEGSYYLYPIPQESWCWNSTSAGCELIWYLGNYQFRSKTEYTIFAEKDEKLEFSISSSKRFKHGRLRIKATSLDFPKKWSWTASWRLETKK
jgi:hypothetical protein